MRTDAYNKSVKRFSELRTTGGLKVNIFHSYIPTQTPEED